MSRTVWREACLQVGRFTDPLAMVARIARGYLLTKFSAATFGRYPVILSAVKLHIRGDAVIGDRFMVGPNPWAVHIKVERGATLTMGSGIGMGGGTHIEAWHDVRIGDNVILAPFVSIIDDGRHPAEPDSALYRRPVVIEANVWLGRNVSVLPGVTIGSGSVIGANAVVSRDIPPNCFAAGAPAKFIAPLNIPDGWTHRFGYENHETPRSIWPMLRRLRGGDNSVQSPVLPAMENLAEASPQLQSRR